LLYTTDDPNRGADALYTIVAQIPESDDIRWKLCAYRALSNAFSRKREWRMAIVALDRMLPELEAATLQEVPHMPIHAQKVLEMAYRAEVLSAQGRYLLHAGAVAEASYVFQVAQAGWNRIQQEAGGDSAADLEGNIVVEHIPAQLFVNEGLLCFAYANYDQAIECFKNAIDHLRKYSISPNYLSADWVGPSIVGVAPHWTLLNECVNNLAICALYTGRLAEAVNLLECLIREDPTAFFTERVAFNLCTMYELGCDSTASATKKRVLQLIAKRWFLHDVGPESFRIS
jgi:tetratricopeptide (TPR) repeat protein